MLDHRRLVMLAGAVVVACMLAPAAYAVLSLADLVPMSPAIFAGWLAWLTLLPGVAGVALWRRARSADAMHARAAGTPAEQQARLAAVGQLTDGIAHDFNNILMTIIAAADLAQRRPRDTAFVEEQLAAVVDHSERAAALVQRIVDWSHHARPALEVVDVAALLTQTAGRLQRTVSETIRVVLEVAPGRFSVVADPGQLRRALTQLASNACDAMPRGGELRFVLARQDGAGAPPMDWIVLRVADTGSGMPADVRERIFEPFFTTKALGHGAGLGLSEVSGVVQQHEGRIVVDSEPGRGTTVSLFLPAHGAAPAMAGAGVAATGRNHTVLSARASAG